MKNKFIYISLSLGIVMVLMMAVASFAASVPRMSTDELKDRLSENNLVVLDVRSPYHWGSTDKKILGAKRVPPGAVADWAADYNKEETLVLYCD